MTSELRRLFRQIIKERIVAQMTIEEEYSVSNYVDNIFIIKVILEDRGFNGENTHLIFINLYKTCDNVAIKNYEILIELR